MAGVSDISDMTTVGIIAALFLHTGDAGAAGQHLCVGLHFDIAQSTGVKEGGPALVGRKDFFKWSRGKTGQHGED